MKLSQTHIPFWCGNRGGQVRVYAWVAVLLAVLPGAWAQMLLQPVDQFVSTGQTAVFTAQAELSPPSFSQWKRNGVFIPGTLQQSGSGQADSSYVIPGVAATNAGTYSVVFWNVNSGTGNNTYESTLAELVVTKIGFLPAGNFFPGGTLSGAQGSLRGSNVVAAVGNELGEPEHGGVPGGSSVWVKWKPQQSGIATFSTSGSGFDTTLGIYTGGAVSNLTLVARDEDRGGFLNSVA